MCLALRASGLWLRYATLQNFLPSFPWIAPHALQPSAIQGKEGIKFCHLATFQVRPDLEEVPDGQEGQLKQGRGREESGGRICTFLFILNDKKLTITLFLCGMSLKSVCPRLLNILEVVPWDKISKSQKVSGNKSI